MFEIAHSKNINLFFNNLSTYHWCHYILYTKPFLYLIIIGVLPHWQVLGIQLLQLTLSSALRFMS